MTAKNMPNMAKKNYKARANYAMRVLRTVFNFAMREYVLADGQSIIASNPVLSGLLYNFPYFSLSSGMGRGCPQGGRGVLQRSYNLMCGTTDTCKSDNELSDIFNHISSVVFHLDF